MTVVTGALKIKNLPADFAITDLISLVKFLEANGAVQFNSSQLTNVVVSAVAPSTADKGVIWWRINEAGSFVGLFTFVGSQWVQAFPVPNGVFKITGNSNEIPQGYTLVTDDLPGFSTAMVNKLQEGWNRDPTDTFWDVFEVVYIGL